MSKKEEQDQDKKIGFWVKVIISLTFGIVLLMVTLLLVFRGPSGPLPPKMPSLMYLRLDSVNSEGVTLITDPTEHEIKILPNGHVSCFDEMYVNDKGVVGNALVDVGALLGGRSIVEKHKPKRLTNQITFDPKTLKGIVLSTHEGRDSIEGEVELVLHPSGRGYFIIFYRGWGDTREYYTNGTLLDH